jgi:hypothetical protein
VIETIVLNQGDSYVLTCQYVLKVDGVEVDQPIDDVTITSQVRAKDDTLVLDCVVEKLAPREDGKVYDFTVTAPAAASRTAPLGEHLSSISYLRANGLRDSTPPFKVLIYRGPTHA